MNGLLAEDFCLYGGAACHVQLAEAHRVIVTEHGTDGTVKFTELVLAASTRPRIVPTAYRCRATVQYVTVRDQGEA